MVKQLHLRRDKLALAVVRLFLSGGKLGSKRLLLSVNAVDRVCYYGSSAFSLCRVAFKLCLSRFKLILGAGKLTVDCRGYLFIQRVELGLGYNNIFLLNQNALVADGSHAVNRF